MSRSRRKDLPIILSHNTRTGIMIYPNRKMGGRDVLIVGLNREIPSGESFALEVDNRQRGVKTTSSIREKS